ncbi:CPBP family intramembrane glutamic endopeptidase [Streptomyces platensis]|uniref:CPBP family intramembrane glutamic endopeptidase n=1 Tax=Streptomyces platensis TaxID=58346 RepID=UPI002E8135D9|nr:CPBP family intramembrane glutamic endopeptidase [Streptomyces platensis]WUB80701.1 CPBP family intramembrane metalloprotease [Streptomyces platensis]
MHETLRPVLAEAPVERPPGPGWPEIVAGLAAYAVLDAAVVGYLRHAVLSDTMAGLIGFVLSAAMGLGAFAVAASLRIRRLAPFGVRRASGRSLLAAVGFGVVAFVLAAIASLLYQAVAGDHQNVQVGYRAAAAGGLHWYLATAVSGFVATPIGEELIFRGVLANALGRYGAWVSVLASATVFALVHGLNPVLPVAFVVGVINAVLLRRTGSVWPGIVVHGVNNALAMSIPVIIALVSW